MSQSPLYQEIVQEARSELLQQATLDLLEDRFGPESRDLEALLKAVAFDRLRELHKLAARGRRLASFRRRLLSS